MPLPKPEGNESQDEWLDRCMGNPTMNEEFPDAQQRAAVCHEQWRDKGKGTSLAARPAADELGELFRRNTLAFQGAAARLLNAQAHLLTGGSSKDEEPALKAMARIIGQTAVLADLLGRRRLLLESDAARRDLDQEETEGFVFALSVRTPVVPQVTFAEAVADLLSREPRLAASAEAVAELYQTEHAFALARSAEMAITRRVQLAIGRMQQVGVTLPTAERIIKEAGPFSRAYAETVYRTNLSTAYTAGRFQQAQDPEVSGVIGAFEYVGPRDVDARQGRPRDGGENHVAAIGLIAATNDPIWANGASPPSGYNCRHTLRLVSRAELRRRGLLHAGRITRHEPPGFADFRAHPRFGSRPDAPIYGGGALFSAQRFAAAWPAAFVAEQGGVRLQ